MYVEPETQYQGTQTDPSETENEGNKYGGNYEIMGLKYHCI